MKASKIGHHLEPLLLLFAAGLCIGLTFPLGKSAAELGLSPLLYIGLSAAGASLVLALICRMAGERIVIDRETLGYAAIAGQITFAIPFGTLLLVIPHLGSGVPAILQSLAPILTLALVLAFGVERPDPLRAGGLCVGLAGAAIILLERNSNSVETHAGVGWYVLALLTPASLALGNVFRTTHWPEGRGHLSLAMLTLAGAALGVATLCTTLYLIGLFPQASTRIASGWRFIAAQSLATGIGYAFFFRLQQVGGPVYISQISYVNTGVGVAFAVLFFGEHLSASIWLSVGLILAGVAMVNRSASNAR